MIDREEKRAFLFYFYKIEKFMDFEKNVKAFLVSLWKLFTPILHWLCESVESESVLSLFVEHLTFFDSEKESESVLSLFVEYFNILWQWKSQESESVPNLFVENWGPASNWQR